MQKFFLAKWLSKVSIAKKLYFTVGIMALLIATELVTLWFAINTLSSVRAYVAAEGLWSKAEKDAVYQLQKYYRTHDETDYVAFQNFMKVPLGDHITRIELAKEHPDMDVARRGFIEGRNHPDDVDGMITLFRRFYGISYISKAISIWAEADPMIAELIPIGENLHAEIISGNPTQEKMNRIISTLDPINEKLTILEDNFSYTLGEGSRWLENLILKLLFAVALTVEVSGLLLTFSVSRGIAKGINAIICASKAIAKGDLSARAKAFSEDEIGVLANSFNQMADDLKDRRDRQSRAEKDLKQQKELYETLVNAQSEMGEGLAITEDKRMVYVNPALCKMYGYSQEEILSMSSFMDLVVEDERMKLEGRINDRTGGKQTADTGETALKRKDGQVINIEYSLKKVNVDGREQLVSIIRDISERREAEEKLKASEQKLAKIFDASPVAISIGRLPTGILVDVNRRFLIMSGFEREEVIGRTTLELNLLDPAEREKLLQEITMNGSIREKEIIITKKSGEKFHALISLDTFTSNGVNYAITSAFDMTERKKSEEEIKQKTEELMRSNKELEHFAYVASHDLQEPLRTVTSYVQLLQKRYKDKLDNNADEFINFTVDATSRMRSLINDLLSYSRVGTQQKEFTNVNINDIIETIRIVLGPSMAENKVQLIADHLPVIKADELQMRQLFQNLISNAIKFKSDKKPLIKISGQKKADHYLFCVEDNGIGIAKEYEKKIFLIFQRLHDRGKYPGTGIGLSVCKKIVELHGGEIWIEPNDNKGTTFCFTIKNES